jgi:predicted O-methyltransferase YrrM
VTAVARRTKGFLADAEAQRLFELAVVASAEAPLLEVGSYCGKSALYLGDGCRRTGRHPLFTVDHHRGNEEQQPGGLFFDPDLHDEVTGRPTTLSHLLAAIDAAGLGDWVIPIVAESTLLGRHWELSPLGLVFIDGGHSEEAAFGDFHTWAPRVGRGGWLAVHDVFPTPADGGQAPFHVVEAALATGDWERVDTVESLAVLVRT